MIKIMSFYSLPVREERIGNVYSLALSTPREVDGVRGRIDVLCPTWEMVKGYKAHRINEAEYTNQYRDLIRKRWPAVKRWLCSLRPDQEMYLCCWEKTGFCHRHLVAKLIRKFRPDLEVRVS